MYRMVPHTVWTAGQMIVEIGGLDMTETTDKMITVTITDTSGGTTDTYCSVNSD